ncbi:hypothetical protein pb186bvf_007866 [Paramecium bursaria]
MIYFSQIFKYNVEQLGTLCKQSHLIFSIKSDMMRLEVKGTLYKLYDEIEELQLIQIGQKNKYRTLKL